MLEQVRHCLLFALAKVSKKKSQKTHTDARTRYSAGRILYCEIVCDAEYRVRHGPDWHVWYLRMSGLVFCPNKHDYIMCMNLDSFWRGSISEWMRNMHVYESVCCVSCQKIRDRTCGVARTSRLIYTMFHAVVIPVDVEYSSHDECASMAAINL